MLAQVGAFFCFLNGQRLDRCERALRNHGKIRYVNTCQWVPSIKLESVESCALNRFMAVR